MSKLDDIRKALRDPKSADRLFPRASGPAAVIRATEEIALQQHDGLEPNVIWHRRLEFKRAKWEVEGKGASDKTYIVEVIERLRAEGTYDVVVKYGRTGGAYRAQVKRRAMARARAISFAEDIVDTKMGKGYKLVDQWEAKF